MTALRVYTYQANERMHRPVPRLESPCTCFVHHLLTINIAYNHICIDSVLDTDVTPMADDAAERFPIRTVSSLTGVHPVTLRAWERRYGLIRPLRTRRGHRLYTHQHVERVRRALALLERGIQISRVRELLGEDAAAGHAMPRHGRWSLYLERVSAAVATFAVDPAPQVVPDESV